ncbi:phosphoribosylamine--glycine ligase [Aerococcaceae bacterium NML180378]|nr:phosphoribosylamine--glycine ligase [Aerococcaceae bacterium NML180378]
MKILVIGSGGREHAFAKKIATSQHVQQVYCTPGNARMAQDGIQLVAIGETDTENLIAFAKMQAIDWVFVGPELPLYHGVSDALEQAGIPVFAPSQAAAKLEYSKDFAKQLMARYRIPTADFRTFTDLDSACAYVKEKGAPIVIKADGLAAGKGVVVAQTLSEALSSLDAIFLDANYTYADGVRVVIEEFLEGEEFSLFAFVNGTKVYFAGVSQDHKRAYDGDTGPNTGGMGAYSPVPHLPNTIIEESMATVVQPIVDALYQEGIPYKGVLYAGLMLTKKGIKVIEFNARFGDPETQVVLQQLESDLARIIDDILHEREPEIQWRENSVTVGVVVAAEGYPNKPVSGFRLGTLAVPTQLELFAAGVEKANDAYVATGGRLFLVSAQAETIDMARKEVYDWLEQQEFPQTFYRKDIGKKALEQ